MARGLANEPMHLFRYRHVDRPGHQLRSGFAADLLRGREQHRFGARAKRQFDPFPSQSPGYGFSDPLARGGDNRHAIA